MALNLTFSFLIPRRQGLYIVHLDAPLTQSSRYTVPSEKSTYHRKAPNELLIMNRRPPKALRNMVTATIVCKEHNKTIRTMNLKK
jgi:hypothetical protein